MALIWKTASAESSCSWLRVLAAASRTLQLPYDKLNRNVFIAIAPLSRLPLRIPSPMYLRVSLRLYLYAHTGCTGFRDGRMETEKKAERKNTSSRSCYSVDESLHNRSQYWRSRTGPHRGYPIGLTNRRIKSDSAPCWNRPCQLV